MKKPEDIIPLSEAQQAMLKTLRDAPIKPKWMAPILRRWLMHRGLITFTSLGGGKYDFVVTDLGLETLLLDEKFKEATKKS